MVGLFAFADGPIYLSKENLRIVRRFQEALAIQRNKNSPTIEGATAKKHRDEED